MRHTMLKFLTTSVVCALLSACGGSDEGAGGAAQVVDREPELRAFVDDVEALAEDKNRRGLLRRISENHARSTRDGSRFDARAAASTTKRDCFARHGELNELISDFAKIRR